MAAVYASEPAPAPAAKGRGVPARLVWALLALVFCLAGWLLLLNDVLGMAGFLVIGVGVGIACAVAGSLAHDALAGPRERL